MPRKNDFIHGRFVDVEDVYSAVVALEKELIECRQENRLLKERLGMPVSTFTYRRD